MCKSSILCATPTILRNPNLRALILEHGSYVMGTTMTSLTPAMRGNFVHSFPHHSFNPYSNGVTVDNLNNFYIYNSDTGECFPMYIVVPCGKCPLCKAKKSREWSFRAICESQSSTNIPYFVTLTYDSKHLPSDGVVKTDLQLFLKRLRRNLDRLSIPHNLRYFACAEYGSNTHRPHYHMILWNFPHMDTFKHEVELIESSWQNGFILCKPCNYGSIGYCMKYMSKEQYIPPTKNKGFFLSSNRGGGIGALYAEQYKDFYRANPTKLDISVVDKFTGESFTSFIPSYFVRKFFPYMSLLIPKKVRDAYNSALYCLDVKSYIIDNSNFPIDNSESSRESLILSRYYFLPSFRSSIPSSDVSHLVSLYNKYVDNTSYKVIGDYYSDIHVLLQRSLSILESYNPAPDFISFISALRSKRTSALNIFFDSSDGYDIDDMLYQLKISNSRSQKREIL